MITDEMIEVFKVPYFDCKKSQHESIRAGLEAVFNHLADARKEKETLVEYIKEIEPDYRFNEECTFLLSLISEYLEQK